MLGAGAMGQPRGRVWGGRRAEGSGWGIPVADSFRYMVKPIQYCKVKKKKKKNYGMVIDILKTLLQTAREGGKTGQDFKPPD